MSRGEENAVVRESSAQNAQDFENAQSSYKAEQGDINDYKTQLAKFAADNPYAAGGEFQTSQNKVLANTSDAAALAAGEAMQSAAVRTGQNAGAGIAATEAIAQQNERNLSGAEANQNAARIAAEAGYDDKVLGASSVPATLQSGVTGTESRGAGEALGVQQQAAKTPGFWDTMGDAFAGSFGGAMGKATAAGVKTEADS